METNGMDDTYLKDALSDAALVLRWMAETIDARKSVLDIVTACVSAIQNRGRVLTCGNGGSYCEAAHLAEEMTGRFRTSRPPLPGIAISDGAHITCTANDFGFDEIFARSVEALGHRGDVLILFSTSGNSSNLVRAAEVARERGILCCGLLGRTGGALRELCDVSIVVPFEGSDRVQEVHLKIVHLIVEGIERVLYPDAYR